MKTKLKKHLDQAGVPLCNVRSHGAFLVEARRHVTCERCKKAYARRVLDAATVKYAH